MTDVQAVIMIGLISIAAAAYSVFGICIALADISNKEILTPKDFHEDKYNWFGSWIIFIGRTLLAAPFYIIFTICIVIYKCVLWLFTAGRKDD